MGRKPRIQIKGGLYFITSKCSPQEDLFPADEDRTQYLEIIEKYRDQMEFKIFAFFLSSTTVNLLIETSGEATISDIMHIINSSYTKLFNTKYSRSGHLFKGRFKSVLLEKPLYLIKTIQFMFYLPVLYRLSETPSSYKWNSYSKYCSPIKGDAAVFEVFSLFSPDTAAAPADFCEQILNADKNHLLQFRKQLSSAWILGSDDFIRSVKTMIKESSEKTAAENQRASFTPNYLSFIVFLIILLFSIALYFYFINRSASEKFILKYEQARSSFSTTLAKEKRVLKKDFSERQKADQVSFEAMERRLEKEKQRASEIEKELQSLKEQAQ